MDFLFVNRQELSALSGLPYLQQSAYLLGIRPYMDRKTFLVGLKRRISYQSLAEALYIEPHQGIKSGSPSRQQLRRAIKALERAGLVEIQSFDKHLVLKCCLADKDYFTENKADTNPTHLGSTKPNLTNNNKSAPYPHKPQNPDMGVMPKADIPHNSEQEREYVRERFNQFWQLYPQKQNHSKAYEEFTRLNPDNKLFNKILSALTAQIHQRQQLTLNGEWVPRWKFPATWLANKSWNDGLLYVEQKENRHETNQHGSRTRSYADLITESCTDFDFDFTGETPSKQTAANIVAFNQAKSN